MPDLDYVKVIGRFGITVGDGADPDETPDTVWCDAGTIRIVPLQQTTRIAGGLPMPWTGGHAVIEASLDADGHLTWNGNPHVWLVDLTSDKVNPKVEDGRATHRLEFVGIKAGGTDVTFAQTTVRLAADNVDPLTGACDLTLLMPVAAGAGTPIVVGPTGASIEDVNVVGDELVVDLDNGEQLTTVLPATLMDSAEFMTEQIETPGTGPNLALSAKIGEEVAPEIGLMAAGQIAASEASAITRGSDDERATPTPDGRTITYLATGQTDQTWATSSCTQSDDTTRVKRGTQSKRFTTAAATTAQAILDPIYPAPAADPLTFSPASLLHAWVWVDDPAKISSVGIQIWSDAGLTISWTRSVTSPALRYGWNLITHKASSGALTGWGTAYRMRAIVVTTAATAFNIGAIWVESPRKAQILLINDRGYKTFADYALPGLRTLGIPLTWALDVTLLGTSVGTKAEVITKANLDTYYAAGDDVSIHAWDGGVTSTKTPTEIREDALKSAAWLQDNGYTRGRRWRAAWTQNNAPNASAAKPYYGAYATTTGGASMETWPFTSKWDVARISLHAATTAQIDGYFTTLQATNSLFVCYTHGIHADGGADMTPANYDYFKSKLDAAVSGGWLEGVTFSQLVARGGGVMRA